MAVEGHKIYKVENHKIYKVIRKRLRTRTSVSTSQDFRVTYPPLEIVRAPIGYLFVFIEYDRAHDFTFQYGSAEIEIWEGVSPDPPIPIPRIAGHWNWIPLYWESCEKGDMKILRTITIDAPYGTYGVKELELHTIIY